VTVEMCSDYCTVAGFRVAVKLNICFKDMWILYFVISRLIVCFWCTDRLFYPVVLMLWLLFRQCCSGAVW